MQFYKIAYFLLEMISKSFGNAEKYVLSIVNILHKIYKSKILNWNNNKKFKNIKIFFDHEYRLYFLKWTQIREDVFSLGKKIVHGDLFY